MPTFQSFVKPENRDRRYLKPSRPQKALYETLSRVRQSFAHQYPLLPFACFVHLVSQSSQFVRLDCGMRQNYDEAGNGGRSSAWLEPQIVDLAVAGSNPVGHPISRPLTARRVRSSIG